MPSPERSRPVRPPPPPATLFFGVITGEEALLDWTRERLEARIDRLRGED